MNFVCIWKKKTNPPLIWKNVCMKVKKINWKIYSDFFFLFIVEFSMMPDNVQNMKAKKWQETPLTKCFQLLFPKVSAKNWDVFFLVYFLYLNFMHVKYECMCVCVFALIMIAFKNVELRSNHFIWFETIQKESKMVHDKKKIKARILKVYHSYGCGCS